MSYLTLAQYQTITGLTLTGVNSIYVDFKLKEYSRQIEQLTGQNFGTVPNPQVVIKKIKQCGDFRIQFGAWLQQPIIQTKRINQTSWQTLTPQTDFNWIYPSFETFVNGVRQSKPIVGIDFSCLSCRYCCEEVKIDGDNRWSNGIPDDLMAILLELTANLLANDPMAYTNGQLPLASLSNQVRSETDQTRSISWFRDDANQKLANQKLVNGVNHPSYTNLLMNYNYYNFNLNRRFYA